jgi:hypothetical protein
MTMSVSLPSRRLQLKLAKNCSSLVPPILIDPTLSRFMFI